MKNAHKKFNHIGISSELDMPRIIHIMKLGLFFAVINIAGDMILGYGAAEAAEYMFPAAHSLIL